MCVIVAFRNEVKSFSLYLSLSLLSLALSISFVLTLPFYQYMTKLLSRTTTASTDVLSRFHIVPKNGRHSST
uniref:Putative secreted peptide n=1 Tax=Anopheles braziliensis TaxID=58242 RepID=A0A2M3ZMW2_9DIPT